MTMLTKNDGPRNSNLSLHTHIHIADIFVRVKYFSSPELMCPAGVHGQVGNNVWREKLTASNECIR